MNKSVVCVQLLVFPFVLLISCNGQYKKSLPQDSHLETNMAQKDTTLSPQQSFVDPLFFIEGQLCAWVRKIYQDKSGNLWFATNHYGLMRYDGDTLEYFSESDGLGYEWNIGHL